MNGKYTDYQPLYTTPDKRTIYNYVIEVLRQFRYSTLWMPIRHMVTIHHNLTLYNDMFDHMDSVVGALDHTKTKWKEDSFFTVKFVRQKMFKYYTEITSTSGMALISAHMVDSFRKL
jgi:hypothetical protein